MIGKKAKIDDFARVDPLLRYWCCVSRKGPVSAGCVRVFLQRLSGSERARRSGIERRCRGSRTGGTWPTPVAVATRVRNLNFAELAAIAAGVSN